MRQGIAIEWVARLLFSALLTAAGCTDEELSTRVDGGAGAAVSPADATAEVRDLDSGDVERSLLDGGLAEADPSDRAIDDGAIDDGGLAEADARSSDSGSGSGSDVPPLSGARSPPTRPELLLQRRAGGCTARSIWGATMQSSRPFPWTPARL